MLRQRVQRVVVAAPPSVVEELEQRFGLTFEVYGRAYVQRKRTERAQLQGFAQELYDVNAR